MLQVSAKPDHIWHRGNSFITISKCSGADIIGGHFSCILSKDNYKGRNQKPYVIRFIQPDTPVRYWFGKLTLFIRTKAACKVELNSLKAMATKIAAAGTDEDENKSQQNEQWCITYAI